MLRSLITSYRISGIDSFVKWGSNNILTKNVPVPGCSVFTSVSLQEDAGKDLETERKSERDRSQVIPVETSIRYLQSEAYQTTYGSDPVWKKYRRNFKGGFPPKKTRKTCIRENMLSTASPCPICRDEYLVLEYRNIDLLKQFVSEYSGAVLSYKKTQICQRRYRELLVAVEKARDYGLLDYDVPFREYDYSEYYETLDNSKK